MKNLVLIAGLVALAACGQKQESNVAEEANVALAEPDANAAAEVTPAAFQLNETTWTFTDKDGQVIQESVEIGQSMETTSDKGEKLTVTRVAYVPMSMPKAQ